MEDHLIDGRRRRSPLGRYWLMAWGAETADHVTVWREETAEHVTVWREEPAEHGTVWREEPAEHVTVWREEPAEHVIIVVVLRGIPMLERYHDTRKKRYATHIF